ncbi:Uncharacterised protein [uncultured archaeon]|nr:Uncharacterised protein [uncultured archaeon]
MATKGTAGEGSSPKGSKGKTRVSEADALKILKELAWRKLELYKSDSLDAIRGIVLQRSKIRGANLDPGKISWEELFKTNVCPNCRGRLTLLGERYLCDTCLIEIPANVYEAAEKQYYGETKLLDDEQQATQNLLDAGYSMNELVELYAKAEKEALTEPRWDKR